MAIRSNIPTFDAGGSGTIGVTTTATVGPTTGGLMSWFDLPDLTSTVTVNIRPGSDTTQVGGFVLDNDRPKVGPVPFATEDLIFDADGTVTINYAYGK